METSLKYDYADGSHVVFDKYTITVTGIVRNVTNGNIVSTQKSGKYNRVNVYDDSGKQRPISVGRALASTFHGPPPSLAHTVDHIDRNPDNDTIDNIRWATKKEQNNNRDCSKINKTAFIIVKDNIEKTAKEWVGHFKDQNNHEEREYTISMITHYAQRKQHGFSYKEYPKFQGEVWKEIEGSNGRWEISNMCRVKYITSNAENVLSGERLGLISGYPTIKLNGKQLYCHIISFKAFYPEEYAAKNPEDIILHKNDDKLDFRPHMLRLGTQSENGNDAHNNGKYDGKKSSRMKCASYINGILEKEYVSQSEAVMYLKSIGYEKAECGNLSKAMNPTFAFDFVYGRTWKRVF